MIPHLRRLVQALAVAWLVLLSCASAQAQPPPDHAPIKEELAAARQLFVDGKALETEGDWAGALEKFETVAKVKMTPQVRFHLALCHEHLGRWVDAVNGFELAEQEARALGAADVVKNAPKHAEALRARLAHITLRITGTVRTSKILLDGHEVSMALVDMAIPVDPGSHQIEVKRGGEVTFSEELELAEAESREIDLEIDDPEPPPPPPPPAGEPVVDQPPPPPSEPPPRWIAYVVGGVGLAAIGGGVITFVLRQQALGNIRCDDPATFSGCNPEDDDTAQIAKQTDIASKVLWGVGGAALVTGVVLWFVLAPDDDQQPATGASSVAVGLAPTPTGLQLVGRF